MLSARVLYVLRIYGGYMLNLIVDKEDEEYYYCKEHRRGHGYLSHLILKKKVKDNPNTHEIEKDYRGKALYLHVVE